MAQHPSQSPRQSASPFGVPQFEPTRSAALAQLEAFLPHAGAEYARLRNFDLPDQGHPHVSKLSPYVRHRALTEAEVLKRVLTQHSPRHAEKFIQEVFWRTYWKGWLERRPAVWTAYRAGVRHGLDRIAVEGGLRADWEAACTGTTGIDAFDAWARELVTTGYLHNHARMWMASIWCFTLRLPWELGADWFLRHLLDGDPASNTLGWRWVAGLQTPGKTYEATAANIAKYTEGRHWPATALAQGVAPLEGAPNPPLGPVPLSDTVNPRLPTALLMTEEDLSPDSLSELFADIPQILGVGVLSGVSARSPLAVAPLVQAFTDALIDDALGRVSAKTKGPPGPVTADPTQIAAWARGLGAAQLVLRYVPQGPARERLSALRALIPDVRLVERICPYDAAAWTHSTAGFFKFKAQIPLLLRGLSQPRLL